MNLNMNLKMNILLSGHICNNHSIMTFSRRKTRYLRQYNKGISDYTHWCQKYTITVTSKRQISLTDIWRKNANTIDKLNFQ